MNTDMQGQCGGVFSSAEGGTEETNYIVTESGDCLITESGDIIVHGEVV